MDRLTWRVTILAGLVLMAVAAPRPSGQHPRIWLTSSVLSELRARASAADPDWLRVKAHADQLLTRQMPRFTVAAATNANPAHLTLVEPVPWIGSTRVFIAGATGAWTALNASGDRPVPIAATRTGPHTFSVPVDSGGFGPFAGQRLALFFSEGGHSAYGYQGSDWQSMLEALGIAYQVTGDAAYAAKGIELVDYITSLGAAGMLAPAAIDSGFPSRSAVYALAIACDWLRDRLSPDRRAAVARTLSLWFDWFTRAAFENNGPAYGNYFGGHVLGFGLAGLAMEADNPRGVEISAHVRGLFEAHVKPAFATGGFAGGYPVEGYVYGANHFQRLLLYMLAVDTATGTDGLARSGYPRMVARNLLYNLKPNGWQVTDEASSPGDYSGVLPPSLPIVLSSLLAGTPEGEWMRHLSQRVIAAPYASRLDDAFIRFLFSGRARPAAAYDPAQPTWFYSPGDGHFYRRSAWHPDAVWTSIAGGAAHWAGHQMRAAGHIAIQRGGDYLLVNSGQWKGDSGVSGTPQAFDLRSWRGNTLFVDDDGDYLLTGADYIGGQGFWGTNQVLAHDGGAEFGYLKTDLTTAYSVGDRKPWASRSVRSFHRSFLSMGSGVVVVFDRVRLRRPGYVARLYFHLNPAGGPPVVSGNTASIRAGRSALFIRALLPVEPVFTAAVDPVSAADPRPITHRLEVSDGIASRTFDALTVLIATSATTTSMPATLRLRSGNGAMVGAMVTDGRVCRIGLFSAAGTVQSSVRYPAGCPPGQTGVHVLVDLVPDVPYVIARDNVPIATAWASAHGVVTFRSSEGGRFSVSPA